MHVAERGDSKCDRSKAGVNNSIQFVIDKDTGNEQLWMHSILIRGRWLAM